MEQIDLADFFRYYLSKFIIVIIIVLAAISAGNIYNLLTRKPLYESNTTIVLARNTEGAGTYTQNDSQLNQKLVSTYSEIIKSRKVVSKVINNLDLDYSIGELQSRISVSSINNTEIIKITVIIRYSTILIHTITLATFSKESNPFTSFFVSLKSSFCSSVKLL